MEKQRLWLKEGTFFDAMHGRDAAYLRKKIENIKLGYELKADVECPNCGRMSSVEVDLNTEFFSTL